MSTATIETTTAAEPELLRLPSGEVKIWRPETPNYRCPDSTLILPAGAPREQWLAARREGIGGSDVSGIVNLNPWSSAYAVWLDKIGAGEDKTQTAAMRWGNLHEPALRQAFIEDTGLRVRACGLMRSKAHPFMQITPDGLTEDGGLFESKTSTSYLAEDWADGQIPDHAELQVQHGMAVTGRSHAWVVGLLDGREWFIRRVERDEALIESLIEIERTFWTVNVLQQIEPDLTPNALGALKRQFSQAIESKVAAPRQLVLDLRTRLDEAKQGIKDWEAAKDQAEAELRLLMGSHNIMVSEGDADEKLATLNQNGTFGEKKFREAYPDLAEKLTITKPALDMDTLKAEHPEKYTEFRARILRTPKLKESK